jgi:ABC-type multidrug transport system ATPase subunit
MNDNLQTINMLTGMIGSSSGTAIIDGKDIHKEMKAIRRSLGFCPQYDIIYPELTVKEHMKVLARSPSANCPLNLCFSSTAT